MKKSKILTLTIVTVLALAMLVSAGFAVDCAHENTVTYKGVDATCETAGWTPALYCNDCGCTLVVREAIAALGHVEVTTEAKEPSCTENGLTAGTVCDRCGVVIVSQQIVEATGHSYDAVVTTEPAVGVEGVKTYTCAACGDSYTESIPALEDETEPTPPPAGEDEEDDPTTPPAEDKDEPVAPPTGGDVQPPVQGGSIVSPKTGDISVFLFMMGATTVFAAVAVMFFAAKKFKA